MFHHLLILLIAGVSTFNYFLDASPIVPVMKHNLGAYVWEDEDWPNEKFRDYLHRCMKYQGDMQPFKKCRLAWSMLDRHYERATNMPANHVIGNDVLTWQNLQLLRGEQEEHREVYVAKLVDRTLTEIGRVTLRAWIAQPLEDYELLRKRQSYPRHFVKQHALFKALNTEMLKFKESENFLLSFWVNDPLKQAASRNYFKISAKKSVENSLNENAALLTGATIFENKKRIFSLLTVVFAAAVLPLYGVNRLMSDSQGSGFDTLANRLIGSGGPVFSLISFIQNKYVQSAGFIAAGVYCGLRVQDEFDWARDSFILSICLQTKLHHVANCLRALENIGNILHTHPELSFAPDKDIGKLVRTFKTSAVTQKLSQLLNSDTFKGKASWAAHYGKILAAYRLMHEHVAELEPLLCAVGELDAYMSIARLYKEFEQGRVRYAFASYDTTASTPTVNFKDLWSPFIDPTYVVPNSIALGIREDTRNLIITGPNEGGKSTFVKAVAIGIILAQSIGIVPASEATITPFSYIATYLNITDDHGKSLFEAQVQRAKHILDHIDGMEKNKHSFVIIDELFNGTDARIGQAASYSIADYLSKNSQVISIFPTHFPQLTQLEKNGRSVNYKVAATLDAQGKISYSFVLEKGASEQNIVLDIMRNEGFNHAIINQASQLLQLKA